MYKPWKDDSGALLTNEFDENHALTLLCSTQGVAYPIHEFPVFSFQQIDTSSKVSKTHFCPRTGTSGSAEVSHANTATTQSASSAHSKALPILQANQDVFRNPFAFLNHQMFKSPSYIVNRIYIHICKLLLCLGLLGTYIDLVGKKVDKTTELED